MMMRSLRFILALVLATTLTLLPISAGIAKSHGSEAGISMSEAGHDCPCCNAMQECASDICILKCFSAAATTVDGPLLVQPLPQSFVQIGALAPPPFSPR